MKFIEKIEILEANVLDAACQWYFDCEQTNCMVDVQPLYEIIAEYVREVINQVESK